MERVIAVPREFVSDPFRRLWVFGITWATLAYLFHTVGARAGFYDKFGWFDIAAHLASGSAVALLVGIVGLHVGLRNRRLLVFVIAVTAACATIWEIVEYYEFLHQLGIWVYFVSFENAASDMASNAVGTAAALVGLDWYCDFDPQFIRE